MRNYIFLAFTAYLLAGCGSKDAVNYYLPTASVVKSQALASNVSIETVSYMSGDRIWYKNKDAFLPYKNSYFAKTQKEFMLEEFDASLSLPNGLLYINVTDSYQLYREGGSDYVLNAKATLEQNGTKTQKNINIQKHGFGIGPKEAARGFEAAVKELSLRLTDEFKTKKNK